MCAKYSTYKNVYLKYFSFSTLCKFMQLASSEWMLGVGIKEFENLYDAEKTNERYCCCDYEYICAQDITLLKSAMGSCPVPCQTYLVVSVQDCTSNVPCTINQTFNLQSENQFSLSSAIFQIPFVQPIEVRTIIALIAIKLHYL